MAGAVFALAVLTAAGAAQIGPAPAQEITVEQLRRELMRSAIEGLQRQRVREQRQDAEELQQENLPDLSQFGTPVYTPRATSRQRSIDCTTIDMGGGNSATHCD
jgi:hypothetical protein